MMEKIMFFDIDGRPLTLIEWGVLVEDRRYVRIGLSNLGHGSGKKRLSTIWLGLNENHSLNEPPLIFESRLFGGKCRGSLGRWRYSTLEEARAGHLRLIFRYRMNRRQWRRRHRGEGMGGVTA